MLVVICLIMVLLLASGVLYLLARFIHHKIFGIRCEGNPDFVYFQAADFPGLQAVPISFPSNRGQMLRGYLYSTGTAPCKGLILFVHGMGGGHTAYTTELYTLAQNGYQIIAYDQTGTMMSDGAALDGFPQGFLDLQAAVTFVKNSPDYRDYPLFLIGHSWGAYTVCNFPHLHERIDGVVALSPFDHIPSLLASLAGSQTGRKLAFLKPFFLLQNLLDFGRVSLFRPSYSLQEADCPVLIFHGDADPVVPLALSPVSIREAFEANSNIQIQICPGRKHNVYASAGAEQYMDQVFSEYAELEKSYHKQIPSEIRREFFEKVDFRRMTVEDPSVMKQITDFLDACPRRPVEN